MPALPSPVRVLTARVPSGDKTGVDRAQPTEPTCLQIIPMSNPAGAEAGIAAAARRFAAAGWSACRPRRSMASPPTRGRTRPVAAIFAAKGRPRFNPLIVPRPVARGGRADRAVSADGRAPCRRLLAGPADASSSPAGETPASADLVTAGLDTVAIRVPAHPVAAGAAPRDRHAACRSQRQPLRPCQPDHAPPMSPPISATAVAVILDAGPTGIGLESTVVGFDGGRARAAPSRRPAASGDRARCSARRLSLPEHGPTGRRRPGCSPSTTRRPRALRLDATDVRPARRCSPSDRAAARRRAGGRRPQPQPVRRPHRGRGEFLCRAPRRSTRRPTGSR